MKICLGGTADTIAAGTSCHTAAYRIDEDVTIKSISFWSKGAIPAGASHAAAGVTLTRVRIGSFYDIAGTGEILSATEPYGDTPMPFDPNAQDPQTLRAGDVIYARLGNGLASDISPVAWMVELDVMAPGVEPATSKMG